MKAALLFSLCNLVVFAVSGCVNTETVTTSTGPDGTVTQTVQRPIVDPFDAALTEAARQLFMLQGGTSY